MESSTAITLFQQLLYLHSGCRQLHRRHHQFRHRQNNIMCHHVPCRCFSTASVVSRTFACRPGVGIFVGKDFFLKMARTSLPSQSELLYIRSLVFSQDVVMRTDCVVSCFTVLALSCTLSSGTTIALQLSSNSPALQIKPCAVLVRRL